MNAYSAMATGVVFLPALTGLVLLALPQLQARASRLGAAASGLSLLLVLLLSALDAEGVQRLWSWSPELQFELSWRLNDGTLALAGLVALVGSLIMQFAGAYFGPTPKGQRAVATLALFEAAMLGLILSDNLFALFAFWELTGLCSFFLINTDADARGDTFEAGQQALLVTAGSALPMLVGFLVLAEHSASLSELATLELPLATQTLAFLLILPGILGKSAQVPLHFWLPGAMAAPTPISGFLHSATMVKAGLILLIYLFPICGDTPWWTASLVPLGAITCLWGSYRALGEDDVKLLMAWSTVSQLGLMAVTLGLATPLAVRAGIMYLFAHALFKAGLFAVVGGIDHAAHSRLLSGLGGLRRRTPVLFAASAVLAASMAGLPPLAGFLSKELVLEKVLLRAPFIHDLAVLAIIIGSIGTVAYSARFLFGVFMGEPRSEGAASAHRLEPAFLIMPVTLALASLALGVLAELTDRWMLEPVTAALLGQALASPRLALWHGVTAPLVLSAVIVGGGLLLYALLAQRRLPRGPERFSGPVLFAAWLGRMQALGGGLNRLLSGLPPSVYFAALIAIGLLWSLPLLVELRGFGAGGWRLEGVLLLLLQLMALAGLVLLRGRLVRVLLLSAVGYTVALFYRLMQAPDLVLTQLLVEVLTTIFFVLTLRFFARQESARPLPFNLPQLSLALLVGLLGAAMVLALARAPEDRALADYYLENAPAITGGLNATNVILADFRAFDTLVETLVVILASLGVAGLLRGAPEAAAPPSAGRFMFQRSCQLMLPMAVMIALALLFKGHDAPGGGFVAALSLAIAAVLMIAAYGVGAFKRLEPWTPGLLAALAGLVFMVSAWLPVLLGQPVLTQGHGEIALLGLELHWNSTLLFEVGVVLGVGGGLTAAALPLWRCTPERTEEVVP